MAVTAGLLQNGSLDNMTKRAIVENFLYIVNKDAQLQQLKANYAQQVLMDNWANRMLLVKSRQLGGSTWILAWFFVEAMLIPGLTVAVVSHEAFATKRLMDKIDIFHKNLPSDFKIEMYHNSDYEKAFPNGSTIYIGTAGQRAFGRGDTIHRALVSEEAHYANASKLLGGLSEAVPIHGYLIRESTPLGESGHYYDSVQECLEGRSNYKLVPLYWWYGEDYRIKRGAMMVPEDERGELELTADEANLVLKQNLVEDQIRWRRWKIRDLKSNGNEAIWPQEYIESLDTCFIGTADKPFSKVDAELLRWSMNGKECLRKEGILEIWKEPAALEKYIMWVDPCGGEAVSKNDPHDGVILRIHAGGLEHVASFRSQMQTKPFAQELAQIGMKYNKALMVVERNGVGKSTLDMLVQVVRYPNLYMHIEKGETLRQSGLGEMVKNTSKVSEKYGWTTTHDNKSRLVSDTIEAIRNGTVVSYDKDLVRQLRGLVFTNKGGIEASHGLHDDRAISFCGAVSLALDARIQVGMSKVVEYDYVTFGKRG
jgi:hypothetical protein